MTVWWLFPRLVVRRLLREFPRVALALTGISLAVSVFLAIRAAEDASVASLRSGFGSTLDLAVRNRNGTFDSAEAATIAKTLDKGFAVRGIREISALQGARALTVYGYEPIEWSTYSALALPAKGSSRNGIFASSDLASDSSSFELSINGTSRSVQFAHLPGSTITLPSRSILIPFSTLHEFWDIDASLTALVLEPRVSGSGADLEAGFPLLELAGGGWYLQSNARRAAQGEQILGAFKGNLRVMVLVMMVVCVYTVSNTARLSVLALQEELAVLRTLGLSRANAGILILIEQAFLGLVGAAIGLSAAGPLSNWLFDLFTGTAATLYGVKASEGVGYSFGDRMAATLVAIGTAVCGAILPAFRAAETSPRINQAPVPTDLGRSHTLSPHLLLGLTVGWGIVAAAAIELESGFLANIATAGVLVLVALTSPWALRSTAALVRKWTSTWGSTAFLAGAQVYRRAHLMGKGSGVLAIAFVLLVGLSFMVTSFESTLESWVRTRIKAGVFVRGAGDNGPGLATNIPSSFVEQVTNSRFVSDVVRFSGVRSTVGETPVILAGADIAVAYRHGSYTLLDGIFDLTALQLGAAVMVSEPAARKLGLKVGDSLEVETHHFRVCAIFQEFATELPILLFERTPFKGIFGMDSVQSLSIYTASGIASEDLTAFVRETAGSDLIVFDNNEIQDSIRKIFRQTFSITTVMEVVVMVIAGFGFTVLMLQGAWERRHELATLRVLGVSRFGLIALFAAETFVMLVPAVFVGIVGGFALGFLLIYVTNPVSFGWALVPAWSARIIVEPLIVASATLILSVIVLAWWSGRQYRAWRMVDV